MKNKTFTFKSVLLFLLICCTYFLSLILLLKNLNIVELYEISILFSLCLFAFTLFVYSFFIKNKFLLYSSLAVFLISLAEIFIIKFKLIPMGIESVAWLNIVFQGAMFVINIFVVIGIYIHYNKVQKNNTIRMLAFENNEAILITYHFSEDIINIEFSKEYEKKWEVFYSSKDFTKKEFLNFVHKEDRVIFLNFLEGKTQMDNIIIIRFVINTKNEFGYITFKNRIQKEKQITFLGVDSTVLQKALSKIEEIDKSKAIMLENLDLAVLEIKLVNKTEKKFTILYSNIAFEEKFSFARDEIINKNIKDVFPLDFETLNDLFLEIIKINMLKEHELYYPLTNSWYKLVGYKSDINKIVIIFNDITKFKKQEEEHKYNVFHDSLTDLYNNRGLHYHLNLLINSEKLICFYIDIVDFSWINNYYSMAFGDEILVMLANELKEYFSKDVIISRYFTDHFVIIIKEPLDEELEAAISFLRNSSGKTYGYGRRSVSVRKNIGYAIYPDDTNDITELVFLASLAMKKAIEINDVAPCHYFPGIKEYKEATIQNIEKLKDAIQKKEITVYFQKIIEVRTNEVVMVESLARWAKPDGKYVPPIIFLKLATEARIINLLENLLISESLRKYSELIKLEEYKNTKLSLNISPIIFLDINTIDFIKSKLELYNLSSENVYIEISEETFVYNLAKCNHIIDLYRKNGFKISIDDFGSAYSSLSILENIDYEVLKIDGKFIQNFNLKKNKKIIEMILQIGSIDNIRIVAEGVETKEMVEYLKSVSCFVHQGYYFHIPENLIE